MLEHRHVLQSTKEVHSKHLAKSCKEKSAGKKWKQAQMFKILTLCPIKSAESSMKDSQKSGPKEWDAIMQRWCLIFYENGIAFNKAASSSFAFVIEERMKFAR